MSRQSQRSAAYFVSGILVAICLGIIANGPTDAEIDQAQYCRMVAMHKSDPIIGWPDFHNTYNTECPKEGK